jgi:outer membrane protein
MLKYLFFIGVYVILASQFILATAEDKNYDEKKVLSISDCITISRQNNPYFAAQTHDVAAAKARIAESRGTLLPTVIGSGGYSRYSEALSNNGTASYSVGIRISQPLFQGGRLWSSLSMAKFNFRAANYQYQTVLQNLILDVKQSYYELLQKQRLVEVAEKSMAKVKIYLQAAHERFRLGLSRQADVLKMEVELSTNELNLIKAKNAVMLAQGKLNNAMGFPVNWSIKIVDNLEHVNILDNEATPDSLIRQAWSNRSELHRIQAQVQAQQAAITLARSEYLPSLNADAAYDWIGSVPSELSKSWHVGLSLSISLFNGFSSRARVSQQKAQLQSLLKEQDGLHQEVSLSVWSVYLKIMEAKEKIGNTQKLVENARENLRIAEGEYKEGLGSMLELIDAQTISVTAEESYISTLADYQIARANLDRMLGVIHIKSRSE